MYCPTCSEEYQLGTLRCPDCGVALVVGEPPVSAVALEAKRIARRNLGLLLIGVGVLFVVGGDAIGRTINLDGGATIWIQAGLGAAFFAAGLFFYSGTKRPARGPDAANEGKWEHL